MTVSESRRHEMQLGLRRMLGDSVGETLMEHLPPVGWADVALTRDVLAVRQDIDGVRKDIDGLRREVDSLRGDIERVRSSVRFLIGATVTVASAILVMLVQLSVSVSQLNP